MRRNDILGFSADVNSDVAALKREFTVIRAARVHPQSAGGGGWNNMVPGCVDV